MSNVAGLSLAPIGEILGATCPAALEAGLGVGQRATMAGRMLWQHHVPSESDLPLDHWGHPVTGEGALSFVSPPSWRPSPNSPEGERRMYGSEATRSGHLALHREAGALRDHLYGLLMCYPEFIH